MENIGIDIRNCGNFISLEEILAYAQFSARYLDTLNEGTGEGSDFLGGLSLPEEITGQLERIETVAHRLRSTSDTTVVIGIGGSYLGARAVIEALSHNFPCQMKKDHEILFAGQNIDEDYMADLIDVLEKRNYSIVVISKSGTTTEPAIAFRILRDHLEKKIGKNKAVNRIVVITDEKKGALRKLADENKYDSFIIPDNVGGRYSVLTPVGLLPIAISGIDIMQIVKGASDMMASTLHNKNASENPSLLYAATRNLLLRNGKNIEIMVSFTSRLHYFSEWWKQLFGESEGKDRKGLFPASVEMTTDLHSLGQYIQDGQRIMFETIISVNSPERKLVIPEEKDDSDGLNYISGKRLSEVNRNAAAGTIIAHTDGEVPVIIMNVPRLTPYFIGQLIYLFELACGISGYMLDVNPFDQPGVEAYKKNMFALLNKPGFEEEEKKLKERIEE
jgi:glucose-6-phosphate isomerase